MIIKSNIEAMQTYTNLTKIDSAFNKSLTKISSGLELPRAQFGGGFFAVANDMEAIYKQYTMGAANVQDAIGFLEVEQTTILQVNDNLLRLTELAQRAATETFNSDQRREMNAEMCVIVSNISKLVQSTMYNEVAVWSTTDIGATKSITIQYGEDRSFYLSVTSMTLSELVLSTGLSLGTVSAAISVISCVNSGVDLLSQKLARLGAQINFVQAKADILSEQALQEKAAETRINELDFAKEMKNFTSLQVVLQASNAMVAPNMKAQMVLQLFGG